MNDAMLGGAEDTDGELGDRWGFRKPNTSAPNVS